VDQLRRVGQRQLSFSLLRGVNGPNPSIQLRIGLLPSGPLTLYFTFPTKYYLKFKNLVSHLLASFVLREAVIVRGRGVREANLPIWKCTSGIVPLNSVEKCDDILHIPLES
jgi:hypothetical protein